MRELKRCEWGGHLTPDTLKPALVPDGVDHSIIYCCPACYITVTAAPEIAKINGVTL